MRRMESSTRGDTRRGSGGRTVVMKNCEPLVLAPELAIESTPAYQQCAVMKR